MTKTVRYIMRLANIVRKFILGYASSDTSNPIDLNNEIERAMNIDILYTDSNSFDGCLRVNKKSLLPEIIINNNDSYYRQEFTIAHELGHLILQWNWVPGKQMVKEPKLLDTLVIAYRHPNDNSPEEVKADEFAANLLMPVKGVKVIYDNSANKDLDMVKYSVSDQYNVSLDAAYHRLYNLKQRGEI